MDKTARRPTLTWDDWWNEHYQTSLTYSRAQLLNLRQYPFLSTARAAQRPPPGDWRTWLFMGGRGAGKTRAGSEWVRFSALQGGCQRIALGKRARALPVAALYGRGKVSHVGTFKALEDEMCRFGSAGFGGSPDRVDALVWAVSVLMLGTAGDPRIRAL